MSYRPGWLAFATLLSLTGCARRQTPPQAERIAILRFENLGGDDSAGWIGRALSVVLETELSAAPDVNIVGSAQMHALDRGLGVRPISAPGVSAERTQSLVAGANRVGYGYYAERGGRLNVHLWIENPQTQKIARVLDVSVPANDAVGAATALARQLTSRPGAPFTRSDTCMRAYALGLESQNPAQAAARMEEAIAADPDFGPAYRSLAELDVQRQDRDAARSVLERGVARTGIAPPEHARLRLELATLDNNAPEKQQALADLTKLAPRDAPLWESFAGVAMARRDYLAAMDGYRHALALDPQNVLLLNEMGYAATYGGRFDEGVAALRKYHELRPKDANALDSLGDLNLITNRYREAEDNYQQAVKLDPNFQNNSDLFKASMARLMTGDVAGAEEIYKRYIAARAVGHDAAAPFLHSEWLWITGRRKQAVAEALAFAQTAETRKDRPTAARAYAGLAIWDLMANARESAQQMAQKAAPLAGQSTAAAVAIARFLAQPSASPAEWESRAERFLPNAAQNNVRDEMLAFALLLDGKFDAAKAPLQRLYDATGTSANEGMPVLLAWCNVQTGNFAAAAPLLALTPVPATTGIGTFSPLWFPRIFDLRASVDAKTGKSADAAQNADLFRKLNGAPAAAPQSSPR